MAARILPIMNITNVKDESRRGFLTFAQYALDQFKYF